MFGIGWTEFLVISLAFLVFLGPKEIPRVFNKLGKLFRDLNAASRELRNQLEIETRDIPRPGEIGREITDELEKTIDGPYAEIRAMDAELKRDLGELDERPRYSEESLEPAALSTAEKPPVAAEIPVVDGAKAGTDAR